MRTAAETWNECIGLALREYRERNGYTQETAARAHNCSQSSWSRQESGQASLDAAELWLGGASLDALMVRAFAIAQRDGVAVTFKNPTEKANV